MWESHWDGALSVAPPLTEKISLLLVLVLSLASQAIFKPAWQAALIPPRKLHLGNDETFSVLPEVGTPKLSPFLSHFSVFTLFLQ